MEVGVLNDYLEWRPRREFDRYVEGVSDEVFQLYSPHTQPQNKSWKRQYPNIYRYELFSQYAWDYIAYIFPQRIKKELQESYINGYRKVISQGWYSDVFLLNYASFAQYAWNSTGPSDEEHWEMLLNHFFDQEVKAYMDEALRHTRFDIRHDIISRMILSHDPKGEFKLWDMYNMTIFPDGLSYDMLDKLEDDAYKSLKAASMAGPIVEHHNGVDDPGNIVDVTRISAERRFHLARSAKHLLQTIDFQDNAKYDLAYKSINAAIEDAEKLQESARELGIMYPMGMHDFKVLQKYKEIRDEIENKLE